MIIYIYTYIYIIYVYIYTYILQVSILSSIGLGLAGQAGLNGHSPQGRRSWLQMVLLGGAGLSDWWRMGA
jgi:hypothetical protein